MGKNWNVSLSTRACGVRRKKKNPLLLRPNEMQNPVKWPIWVGIADIYEKNKN